MDAQHIARRRWSLRCKTRHECQSEAVLMVHAPPAKPVPVPTHLKAPCRTLLPAPRCKPRLARTSAMLDVGAAICGRGSACASGPASGNPRGCAGAVPRPRPAGAASANHAARDAGHARTCRPHIPNTTHEACGNKEWRRMGTQPARRDEHTDRQADRGRATRQTDRPTERPKAIPTDRQTDRQTDGQTDRQTGRQARRQTDSGTQTDRQTN